MRRFKATIPLFCLAIFPVIAQAQEKLDKLFSETTAQERAELQTEMMLERLIINEDQKAKVYDINLTYAQKLEDTYKASTTKMERFRNMKAVSDEKDRTLKGVLSESQYELYQKYKEEMRRKLREKRKER